MALVLTSAVAKLRDPTLGAAICRPTVHESVHHENANDRVGVAVHSLGINVFVGVIKINSTLLENYNESDAGRCCKNCSGVTKSVLGPSKPCTKLKPQQNKSLARKLTCVSDDLDDPDAMLVTLENFDALLKFIHPRPHSEVGTGRVEHFWRYDNLQDHSGVPLKCLQALSLLTTQESSLYVLCAISYPSTHLQTLSALNVPRLYGRVCSSCEKNPTTAVSCHGRDCSRMTPKLFQASSRFKTPASCCHISAPSHQNVSSSY